MAGPQGGRPTRHTTVKTREVANKIAKDGGITPLEVMINVMRMRYEAKDYLVAASIAKDAAPYVHPKLANVEYTGNAEAPMVIQLVRFSGEEPASGAIDLEDDD